MVPNSRAALGLRAAWGAVPSGKKVKEIINAAEAGETTEARGPPAVQSGMSVPIIERAFLGIAQRLVGLIDLNKACVGSMLLICIRVILLGKSPIGFFKLIVVCAALYP